MKKTVNKEKNEENQKILQTLINSYELLEEKLYQRNKRIDKLNSELQKDSKEMKFKSNLEGFLEILLKKLGLKVNNNSKISKTYPC